MQLGSSTTQVFYHLLDLDDNQKQDFLQKLKQSSLELYQSVMPLLEADGQEPFTQLLGFHAQQATHATLDLSGHLIDKYQLTHELGRGGMG